MKEKISLKLVLMVSFSVHMAERIAQTITFTAKEDSLVESKSPVPQENIAETIFYEVPARYVLQVQLQLKAYNCTELWLVCSTAISYSVIVVYFDEDLWNNIWTVVIDLYGER